MTSDNELGAAQESYTRFLALLKTGMIATAIVTILVIVLIS